MPLVNHRAACGFVPLLSSSAAGKVARLEERTVSLQAAGLDAQQMVVAVVGVPDAQQMVVAVVGVPDAHPAAVAGVPLQRAMTKAESLRAKIWLDR
jgi:hypothetical protein